MNPKFGYPATAEDYRERARARLPGFLFDYLDGGATDEQTLRANESEWASIKLRQRVLINVDQVDTATTLLGQPCSMPVVLAPPGAGRNDGPAWMCFVPWLRVPGVSW